MSKRHRPSRRRSIAKRAKIRIGQRKQWAAFYSSPYRIVSEDELLAALQRNYHQ